MIPEKKPVENIVGKGENAGNQHFSPFPTVFFTVSKTEIIILVIFILSSKLLSFGKELNCACPEHYFYVYQWISKKLRTFVLLNKFWCHVKSLF